MPTANFEELCSGFCEIAGFPAPRLVADRKGRLAMSVRLRGVYVSAMQSGQSDSAILVAELGAMPEAQALAGWLALMDANLFMMDVDAPRFSRHPRSGEVILQWNCPLWDVSPTEVYRRVTQMVEVALLWREDPLLGGAEAPSAEWSGTAPTAMPEDDATLTAAARFSLLHQDICQALGQPLPLPLEATGDCTFPIRMPALDMDVSVGHFPSRQPGAVFAALPFHAPAHAGLLEQVTAMMDANFKVMRDRQSPTFCRDPWTGQMTLVYATALDGADAQQFLLQLANLVVLARKWNQCQPESSHGGTQMSLELAA